MALTNKLKPLVDLPVWEWLRFAPVSSSALSALTTAGSGQNRYVYYPNSTVLWKYDTYTDGWQQLKAIFPNAAPLSNLATQYKGFDGTYGYVVSATSGSITGPFLDNLQLSGNTIRIINGTGDGQERTLVRPDNDLESVIEGDKFIVTTVNNSTTQAFAVTDSSKKWRINQWRNWQCRIYLGPGQGSTVRKILYNNQDTLFLADAKWHAIEPHLAFGHIWEGNAPIAAASQGRIEAFTYNIDTAWDVIPDNTSKFVVLTGGVWFITMMSLAPFYAMAYYDIAADVYYAKRSLNGIWLANSATDLCIERMGEFAGFYASGSIDSWTTRSININATASLPNPFIPNNFVGAKLRTQNGQELTIKSNGTASVDVVKTFDATGSIGDRFWILPDNDKLYFSGNSGSALFQYSVKNDSPYMGMRYDYGVIASGSVRFQNNYDMCIPVQQINRVGAQAQVTTSIAHPFRDGDLIVVQGAVGTDGPVYNTTGSRVTGSGYEVTSTGLTGSLYFTYPLTSTPGGSAIFNLLTTAQIVDPTKQWQTNEHAGKTLQVWAESGSFNTTAQYRNILSNTSQSIILATPFSTLPGTGMWAYNIVEGRAFGGTRGLGTGSFAQSGSVVSGQPYVYITGSFGTGTASFKIGAPIGGPGIPGGTIIRGWDDRGGNVNWPVTMSISQNATSTTYGGYTSSLDASAGWGIGTATGSTTLLTDTNKVWMTNTWASSRIKITSGTNVGYEGLITANTANGLTISPAAGASFDPTSQYSIIPIQPRGLGHQMLWYADADSPKSGKYIYSFRGAATFQIDRYNITKHEWESFVPNPISIETLTTGTMFAYDGADRIYFTKDQTGRVYYLDLDLNEIQVWGQVPYGMNTAIIGNRMVVCQTSEGFKYLYIMRHTATEFWRSALIV